MDTMDWLLVVGGGLVAAYVVLLAGLVVLGRRTDARAWAGFIPDCIVLIRRLLTDGRLPRRPKLLLGALGLYLATPIDLVPDFLPVIGQLDDAIIVAWALRAVIRAAGADLVREHWPGPERSLNAVLRLAAHRA